MRFVAGALGLILLLGSAVHVAPAIRAGLHDGIRGSWVATSQRCSKTACIWSGKFVLPGGQVKIASAQYGGRLPLAIHAGSRVPALDTGQAGLVYSANGSDLWISLIIAMAVGALALFWAVRRPLRDYLRRRRETVAAAAGEPARLTPPRADGATGAAASWLAWPGSRRRAPRRGAPPASAARRRKCLGDLQRAAGIRRDQQVGAR